MPVFPNAGGGTPEDFEDLFRRLFHGTEPPTVGRGTLISPLHPAVREMGKATEEVAKVIYDLGEENRRLRRALETYKVNLLRLANDNPTLAKTGFVRDLVEAADAIAKLPDQSEEEKR